MKLVNSNVYIDHNGLFIDGFFNKASIMVTLFNLEEEKEVIIEYQSDETDNGIGFRFDSLDLKKFVIRKIVTDDIELMSLEEMSFFKDFCKLEYYLAKNKRWGSAEVQFFIFLNYFKWVTYEKKKHAHICHIFLILSYKAVETNIPENIHYVDIAFSQIMNICDGKLKSKPMFPKFNREHMRISLLTSRVHVLIAKGEYLSLIENLIKIFNEAKKAKYFFSTAFNLNKCLLLLYSIYFYEKKFDEAGEVKLQMILNFNIAAQQSLMEVPTLFNELSSSHQSVYKAIIFNDKMLNEDFLEVCLRTPELSKKLLFLIKNNKEPLPKIINERLSNSAFLDEFKVKYDNKAPEIIRDLALALEGENRITLAYELMNIAKLERQNGPLINSKINTYKNKILKER